MKQVYHTSPNQINKITTQGLFDDCLFFSTDIYSMSTKGASFIYSMNLDDSDIVDVSELHDEEIIADIMQVMSVDEDGAERMLDGRDNAYDHDGTGEDDWWLQAQQGACAKKMGYVACEATDEQGAVYIVPMSDRESTLITV